VNISFCMISNSECSTVVATLGGSVADADQLGPMIGHHSLLNATFIR